MVLNAAVDTWSSVCSIVPQSPVRLRLRLLGETCSVVGQEGLLVSRQNQRFTAHALGRAEDQSDEVT